MWRSSFTEIFFESIPGAKVYDYEQVELNSEKWFHESHETLLKHLREDSPFTDAYEFLRAFLPQKYKEDHKKAIDYVDAMCKVTIWTRRRK